MSNRTTECYSAVFDLIENSVFKMEPTEFITDFEPALRNAINKMYPGIPLRGCWFHYCKAIKAMALKLGLGPEFKAVQVARFIYYKLLSLPLLPPEDFLYGYDSIKRHAKNTNLLAKFQPLFAYFEKFWLAQVINSIIA